jgi:hypothetical protein
VRRALSFLSVIVPRWKKRQSEAMPQVSQLGERDSPRPKSIVNVLRCAAICGHGPDV